MTQTILAGFGSGAIEFNTGLTVAAITVQSVIKRSGTHALRINTTAAAAVTIFTGRRAAGGLVSECLSFRVALRVGALPSANTRIAGVGPVSLATANDQLWLNSNGTLSVGRSTTPEATSTNALTADGLWHLIEFDANWNAGAGRRVFVDGVEWATIGTTASTPNTTVRLAVGDAATADLYFADLVVEDGPLGGSWADWKVTAMPVISDSALGSWVGGAGGVTNLFAALDNVPPVGVAAGSDSNTSQIQNAVSVISGPAYDANVQSYTAHGIGASDTIRAVQAICAHAEGIATGTKSGDLAIVSNPAAAALTFDYGDDGGAAGAYVSGWRWNRSAVAASPSVTLGTSPVVRVRKTDTGTREAHVCWLAVYVLWSPATGPTTVTATAALGLQMALSGTATGVQLAQATPGLQLALAPSAVQVAPAQATPGLQMALSGTATRVHVTSATPGLEMALAPAGLAQRLAQAAPGLQLALSGMATAQMLAQATPGLQLALVPSAGQIVQADAALGMELNLAPSATRVQLAQATPGLQMALAPAAVQVAPAQATLGLQMTLAPAAVVTAFATAAPGLELALLPSTTGLQVAQAALGLQMALSATAEAVAVAQASPGLVMALAPSALQLAAAQASPGLQLALSPAAEATLFATAAPALELSLAPAAVTVTFADATLGLQLELVVVAVLGIPLVPVDAPAVVLAVLTHRARSGVPIATHPAAVPSAQRATVRGVERND